MSKYYGPNYYDKPSLVFSIVQSLRKKVFSRLKPGKVLDIGCGSGNFLSGMRSEGWDCFGTEISESSKKFTDKLKSEGIEIHYSELTKTDFSRESFDLITLWHVVEHLREPGKYIRHAKKLLKKDGILFLAFPNIDSISFALWKCNWFHLDLPRHLYHFSPKSIPVLMEKNGFRVISISHYCQEFNPYGVLQSIYNSLGFEFNFLSRQLKNKADVSKPSYYPLLALTVLSLPLLFLPSFALAYLFAFMGRGDIIQIMAKKK